MFIIEKKFDQWFYKRGKRGMQRELEELLRAQDRQGFVNQIQGVLGERRESGEGLFICKPVVSDMFF
jgi:hypothetical protein